MFSKCLFIFLSITWNLGWSIPVYYDEVQKSPSCDFWNQKNTEKSFLYLIGTTVNIEIETIRLITYYDNILFEGMKPIHPSEDPALEERLVSEKDDTTELNELLQNMMTLRAIINEYFLPRVKNIINLEFSMLEYTKFPFYNEFTVLNIKLHDLDCLLKHWIKKLKPGQEEVVYTVDEVDFDIVYVHTDEIFVLKRLVEKLDWFLGSQVLVTIVRDVYKPKLNDDGGGDDDNAKVMVRQLKLWMNY